MKLYKQSPQQQAQQNMHGQIGKNILQSQLGGAMGIGVQSQQQNFQLQQQQALQQQAPKTTTIPTLQLQFLYVLISFLQRIAEPSAVQNALNLGI